MELVCPRCGTHQPPDALSFSCVKCGADLGAGAQKPQLEVVDLRPSQDRADRKLVTSGKMPRVALAILVIGISGLLLFAALHWLPLLFVEERTVREALDDSPDGGIPALRNELPAAAAASTTAPVRPSGEGWPLPDAGIVRGRLVWQRVRRPPVIPFLVSDPQCGATVTVPRLSLGELGGINEALVMVVPDEAAAPAPRPSGRELTATIRACMPSPRLLAGPAGTPVEIGSVGGAHHQLVSDVPLPGLPASLSQGQVVKTFLPPGGTAHLTDPSHPWERFTLVAVPTTLWSTVNAEGFFRIEGVPPGDATMRVYTEGTGPFERRIHLARAGDVMVVVDLADETPGFGHVSQP